MDKIKRYEKSHREGTKIFVKTMIVTLMCIMALICGFVGAAFLSGTSLL